MEVPERRSERERERRESNALRDVLRVREERETP
jgi:hypothetical protein